MKVCIVGTGRCGSKLLGSSLNKHPELSVFNETHWIPKMHEFFGNQKVGWRQILQVAEKTTWVHGESLLVENCRLSPFESYRDFRESLDCRLATIGSLNIRDFCETVADILFDSPIYWGDKTPDYGYYMSLLQNLWPECKFIHITRDPLSTAYSMSQHPGFQLMASSGHDNWCNLSYDHLYRQLKSRRTGIQTYLDLWRRRISRIRDESKRLRPGTYMELKYEDFLTEPEISIGEMANFISLDENSAWVQEIRGSINTDKAANIHDPAILFRIPPPKLRMINLYHKQKLFRPVESNTDLQQVVNQSTRMLEEDSATDSNQLILGVMSGRLATFDQELLSECVNNLIEGLANQGLSECAEFWSNWRKRRFHAKPTESCNAPGHSDNSRIQFQGSASELTMISSRAFDHLPNEVVIYCNVRDEILRLPHFIQYHREMGVQKFVFVDNNSQDGSRDFLLEQPDCTVYWTDESYAEADFGIKWINSLLGLHAVNRWALILDADELLCFPKCEKLGVSALTKYIDSTGCDAFSTFLLDMYGDCPIRDVNYSSGERFLDKCPYFDRYSYDMSHSGQHTGVPMRGGVRQRLFWENGKRDTKAPFLPKIPLVKWRSDLHYTASTHSIENVKLANVSGALLHFKLLDDFVSKIELEAERGEHYQAGSEYKIYSSVLKGLPNLNPMFDGSVKYKNSEQLVRLGFIRSPHDYPLPR